MKNYGGSPKSPIFREKFTKNQCIGRNCLKSGAWTVCRFKGGVALGKKERVVFLKGGWTKFEEGGGGRHYRGVFIK